MPTPQQTHKQVDLPMQIRAASFVPGAVDSAARTAEMVWSTGATVRRTDWMTGRQYDEILAMDSASVDLSRLNNGAPLLNSHFCCQRAGAAHLFELPLATQRKLRTDHDAKRAQNQQLDEHIFPLTQKNTRITEFA